MHKKKTRPAPKQKPSKKAPPQKQIPKTPDKKLPGNRPPEPPPEKTGYIQGAKKEIAFKEFVIWMAIPVYFKTPEGQATTGEWMPKDQNEFAKQWNVSPDTLTNWKRTPGFWDKVTVERKESWGREKTSNVLHSLLTRCLRNGDPVAIRLWLEHVEGWNPKIRVEDETPPKELPPELRAQLLAAFKLTGVAAIQSDNKKREADFLASEDEEAASDNSQEYDDEDDDNSEDEEV